MLSDASNKITYAGDGMTTVFTIPFTLPSGSTGTDVYVYVIDASGNVTLLTSNYVVDVNALTVTYPTVGGVAPLGPGVNFLPLGWEITLVREEPLSQTLALLNQGVLDLPSIEKTFDKILMICQQFREQLNRCYKGPINMPDVETGAVVPPDTSVLTTTTGTLAQLIVLSNATPTVPRFGIATDYANQLVEYPGYASTNGLAGSGWYAIAGGQ